MGEIAEWMCDQAIWQEAEYKNKHIEESWAIEDIKKRYNSGVLKWTTKDGQEIKVSKMTKQHIRNTTKFLKRNGATKVQKCWIEIFEIELERRQ